MHMIFRTLWHYLFVGRRGKRIGFGDVSRSRFRVWPTDLDINLHMNNGKYLSIMDVGRFDLIQRIGLVEVFKREGWYPVVASQTITYRKSLSPWQRFWIESRIVGFDDRAVLIEQRFVRREHGTPQIYARGVVRGRILGKRSGPVPIDEVIEKCGANRADFALEPWIGDWAEATRLPATRADAASAWD